MQNLIKHDRIVELKFQKHGCPRSRNTATGELQKSGPLREQPTRTARIETYQSQLLKTNQSQWSIMLYKVSHNKSTSLPDEDYQYAVEMSRFTS